MGLNCVKLMLKKLLQLFELKITAVTKQIELYDQQILKWSAEEKWHLETGRKFNELIGHYPISDDELLKMSQVLCEFAQLTRITDIDKYFFINEDREIPRLPFMLKNDMPNKA